MPTASEWIDTVISRAGELRKAGVSTIAIDGCSVSLMPDRTVDDSPPTGDPVVEPDADPLTSPSTYADGKVPGFQREKDPLR